MKKPEDIVWIGRRRFRRKDAYRICFWMVLQLVSFSAMLTAAALTSLKVHDLRQIVALGLSLYLSAGLVFCVDFATSDLC